MRLSFDNQDIRLALIAYAATVITVREDQTIVVGAIPDGLSIDLSIVNEGEEAPEPAAGPSIKEAVATSTKGRRGRKSAAETPTDVTPKVDTAAAAPVVQAEVQAVAAAAPFQPDTVAGQAVQPQAAPAAPLFQPQAPVPVPPTAQPEAPAAQAGGTGPALFQNATTPPAQAEEAAAPVAPSTGLFGKFTPPTNP